MAGNTGGKVPKTPKARALGAALRQARESKEMTLRGLADIIGRSPSIVSRWETGDRTPKPEEVARYLTALGVDEDLYEKVMALTEGSDDPLWIAITLPEQRQHLAALVDFESHATAITQVQPLMVPGLLQTTSYIRAIMENGPAGEVAMRVAVRIGRRDVLTRDNPVPLLALVGEAALWNLIGSPEVMVEQMRHLLDMTTRLNVTIQVIPHDSGWTPALEGAFLFIESEHSDPIVHIENRQSGLFVHESPELGTYRKAVDSVLGKVLTQEQSSELITNYLNRWEMDK
jgi:transcriptional regulator with XRE-family HTH domain